MRKSILDTLVENAAKEKADPGSQSVWFVGWGEDEIVFKATVHKQPPRFYGLAERYQWRLEEIKEDGGFKRVFAQWLAGKCYTLAHWLENIGG